MSCSSRSSQILFSVEIGYIFVGGKRFALYSFFFTHPEVEKNLRQWRKTSDKWDRIALLFFHRWSFYSAWKFPSECRCLAAKKQAAVLLKNFESVSKVEELNDELAILENFYSIEGTICILLKKFFDKTWNRRSRMLGSPFNFLYANARMDTSSFLRWQRHAFFL